MKLVSAVLALQISLGIVFARSLQPWKYSPLPLGSIKPTGWLRGEMEAMATGLAGHEHEFYVYVNWSSWLRDPGVGGVEYSDLNEALPYWFNGLVPLAYQLDDDRLKVQVHKVAGAVLGHQAADGWIGPEVGDKRNFWARAPFFLGLTQLAEANSTWEAGIVGGLRKFMNLTHAMLNNDGQGFTNCQGLDCSWGQARIHDLIITVQWLIEKYPSNQDGLLWEIMDMFYSQNPLKWDKWYTEGVYQKVIDGAPFAYIHGVNVGQGLKASSVIYRNTGDPNLVQKSKNAVDWTFKYHGSSSGSILADELQSGHLAPYNGSELCTTVETAYSLAYMYQVLGNSDFADRAERTIFNALPVMLTGDKWAHQYMDQPNQPYAINTKQSDGSIPNVFTTANSGLATTFGMEPQYPCCTVNHPQGYPKYVSNSWVQVGGRGLGHVLLGPSTVNTNINGGSVKIECNTAYPFEAKITYKIQADHDFDLFVRIPRSSDSNAPTLSVAGSLPRRTIPDSVTKMVKIPVKAGQTQLALALGTGIRKETRPNNSISIFYGNMLYSLDIGFQQSSSYPHSFRDQQGPVLDYLPYKEQLRDYYISNSQPWNVAIDPSTLTFTGMGSAPIVDPVFEHGAAPTYMTVEGCEINWGLYKGVTPDWAPVDRQCTGPRQTYKMIPFGSAKVHMSDLPIITF